MKSSKQYVLGADPGKHGAIVLLSTKYNPVRIAPDDIICFTAHTKGDHLDIMRTWKELLPYADRIVLCAQEEVHAIFGVSAAATFGFGEVNGALSAMLQLLGTTRPSKEPFDVLYVSPKVWQHKVWDPADIKYKKDTDKLGRKKKDTKATSLSAAATIFPGVSFKKGKSRLPHDGIVDAALIAYYALCKFRG